MSLLVKELRRRYSQFLNDPLCVYKKCVDTLRKDSSRKWLVVLRKTKNTRTNELRSSVLPENRKNAKYRGSEFKVMVIINLNDPKLTVQWIRSRWDSSLIDYKVGKKVFPDRYDEDIEEVCSNGIHYYLDIECAISYEEIPKRYTGNCVLYNDNGISLGYTQYLNGRKHGNCTLTTHEYRYEGRYENGKKVGIWKTISNDIVIFHEADNTGNIIKQAIMFPSGKKKLEWIYSNFEKDIYTYTEWDEDGNVLDEGKCL